MVRLCSHWIGFCACPLHEKLSLNKLGVKRHKMFILKSIYVAILKIAAFSWRLFISKTIPILFTLQLKRRKKLSKNFKLYLRDHCKIIADTKLLYRPRFSHSSPSKLGAHLQENVPSLFSKHCAPFLHGLPSHGVTERKKTNRLELIWKS